MKMSNVSTSGDRGLSRFKSPYEQYADRVGQEFTVVRKITEPDATHDEEVLPMYVIQFSDGVQIEAWPEEVEDK